MLVMQHRIGLFVQIHATMYGAGCFTERSEWMARRSGSTVCGGFRIQHFQMSKKMCVCVCLTTIQTHALRLHTDTLTHTHACRRVRSYVNDTNGICSAILTVLTFFFVLSNLLVELWARATCWNAKDIEIKKLPKKPKENGKKAQIRRRIMQIDSHISIL